MTNLDDLERNLLADARAFIEPDRADEQRVYSQLSAALVLGGAATASGIVAPDRGASAALRHFGSTSRALAVSAALVSAVAGFGAGFVTGRHSQRADATVARAVVAPPPAALPSTPALAVSAPSTGDKVPESTAQPKRHGKSAEPAARLQPDAIETESTTTDSVAADPIGEEVALLKRAERAIRYENALLALGLLRELDRRFPQGKLLDERAAARVMAQCLQLEPDAARAAGESYLRRASSNLYHDRVRRLCSVADAAPAEKDATPEKALTPSGD